MTSTEDTIDEALRKVGLRARAIQITRTINAALAAAGLLRRAPPGPPAAEHPAQAPVLLKEVDSVHVPQDTEVSAGSFTSRTFLGEAGSLGYKLYVPSTPAVAAMPLIVMLHGCKQNPDDFAAGTRMNLLAEEHGFAVAYPAQTVRANGSNCWNWFVPAQQQRHGREPALIAGMVGEVVRHLDADRRRVYVAGLSAGAAMAVVLGSRYPELFAGVAAHSGLPLGAAHDVASAFAAMRGQRGPASAGAPSLPAAPVRTIVLHGDADATVAAVNADDVVAQASAAYARGGVALRPAGRVATVVNGRQAVRTDHLDPDGRVAIRDWRVQGGGHAWFGGSTAGSYTDASGPDASAEIVDFFLAAR